MYFLIPLLILIFIIWQVGDGKKGNTIYKGVIRDKCWQLRLGNNLSSFEKDPWSIVPAVFFEKKSEKDCCDMCDKKSSELIEFKTFLHYLTEVMFQEHEENWNHLSEPKLYFVCQECLSNYQKNRSAKFFVSDNAGVYLLMRDLHKYRIHAIEDSMGFLPFSFPSTTTQPAAKPSDDWLYYKNQRNGKRIYDNYGVYEGDFYNGLPNGKGKMIYDNGDKYMGDFHNGLLQGKGKMMYAKGNIYDGEFYDDLPHGIGSMTWRDGSIAKGNWKDGKFNS
jgi:hypothetical protein